MFGMMNTFKNERQQTSSSSKVDVKNTQALLFNGCTCMCHIYTLTFILEYNLSGINSSSLSEIYSKEILKKLWPNN